MNSKCLVVGIVLCCCFVPSVYGNVVLHVQGDTRRAMDLGVFGFGDNGFFKLKVEDFFVSDPEFIQENGVIHNGEPIGFLLDPVASAQEARVEKNYARTDAAQRRQCFIDDPNLKPANIEQRHIFPLNGKKLDELTATVFSTTITNRGLYAIFFYNCKGYNDTTQMSVLKPIAVSFTVHATMYNVDENGNKNYLSKGDQPLPVVYTLFGLVFLSLGIYWIRILKNNPLHIHGIHRVMTFLVLVKALSLFLEAAKFAHYSSSGTASAWDVFYYIVLTVKGIILFSVLALLGTGWSIIKGHLSDNDKKLLLSLIIFQILINITLAFIEEKSEGNASWKNYFDILQVLDLICCVAVLMPIIWSMKNLRDAAERDESARRSMGRMKLFRTFYIVIVGYIYFTRIVMTMIEGGVSFERLWLVKVFRELAAVAFYTYCGAKFQPSAENPYIAVGKDQEDDDEEMSARSEVA